MMMNKIWTKSGFLEDTLMSVVDGRSTKVARVPVTSLLHGLSEKPKEPEKPIEPPKKSFWKRITGG